MWSYSYWKNDTIQNLIIITTITIILLFNELQLEKELYYSIVAEKINIVKFKIS